MKFHSNPNKFELVYPFNRPGPFRPDLRQSNINLGFHIREFNLATPSVPNIEKIDWNSIKSVGKSQSGTSGVVFIETNEGGSVLKGSNEVAVEYFAYLLFKSLKIPVPNIRIVNLKDKEFKIIQDNIDRCTFHNDSINRIVKNRLNCPFLFIMEYIPGLPITELGEKKTKIVFDSNYPGSRNRLIKLGMIIATDTFINNSDRYPLIWYNILGEDNQGNADNLIVKMETTFINTTEEMIDKNNINLGFDLFYAIDNRPNLLQRNNRLSIPNIIKYFNELEKMMESLFNELNEVKAAKIDPTLLNSDFQFNSIYRITNFINKITSIKLKPMSEFQIMLGMVLQYINISEMGTNRILQIYKKLDKYIDNDWKDIWKNSLEQINLEFFDDCIGIFRRILTKYDDIVNWVKSITLQQYRINWLEEDEKENLGEKKDANKNDVLLLENFEEFIMKDNNNSYKDINNEDKEKALKSFYKEKDDWMNRKLNEHFGIQENTKRTGKI